MAALNYQNVQGDLPPGAAPDLTGGAGDFGLCDDKGAPLAVRVCNRGVEPVGAGVPVTFYLGDPAAGETICTARTQVALAPGQCAVATCPWPDPPATRITVVAVADDDGSGGGENRECAEGNNLARFEGVPCPIVE